MNLVYMGLSIQVQCRPSLETRPLVQEGSSLVSRLVSVQHGPDLATTKADFEPEFSHSCGR